MPTRLARRVAILNRSSVLTDEQARAIVVALKVQVSRDFAPTWAIDATISFVGLKQTTGWQGRWNILLLDDSDTAGALGYHDLTPEGLPVAKVFAGTDLKYGAEPSVTASHELLEMLLDPNVNLTAEDTRRGLFVAYEASDAVEADELAYEINDVKVSDFVTPEFFDPTAKGRKGARFSFKGNVHAPFALAPGGYEAVYVPGKGWTQNVARDQPRLSDRPKVGSRRERRFAGHGTWARSAD